jgi:hypothetical protein
VSKPPISKNSGSERARGQGNADNAARSWTARCGGELPAGQRVKRAPRGGCLNVWTLKKWRPVGTAGCRGQSDYGSSGIAAGLWHSGRTGESSVAKWCVITAALIGGGMVFDCLHNDQLYPTFSADCQVGFSKPSGPIRFLCMRKLSLDFPMEVKLTHAESPRVLSQVQRSARNDLRFRLCGEVNSHYRNGEAAPRHI